MLLLILLSLLMSQFLPQADGVAVVAAIAVADAAAVSAAATVIADDADYYVTG